MNRQDLRVAQRAAEQAAQRFADQGQTDEAAISQLMADRYAQQIADTKET